MRGFAWVGIGLAVGCGRVGFDPSRDDVDPRAYFVAKTGDDANPGTFEQPFATIAKGLDVVSPGYTVYLLEGVYDEAITAIPAGTSWLEPVRVAAYPEHAVTLRPTSGRNIIALGGADTRFIVIEGLVLDGAGVTDTIVAVSGVPDVPDTGPTHIRITRTEIKNGAAGGIALDRYVRECELTDLWIHDIAGYGIIAIQGSSPTLIERNLIHDIGITGVRFWLSPVTGNRVRHNEIFRTGDHAIRFSSSTADNIVEGNWIHEASQTDPGSAGISMNGASKVINNVVYSGAGYGIRSEGGTHQFFNNTIYGNAGAAIRVFVGSVDVEVRNNIMRGNGALFSFSNTDATATIVSHNLTDVDPLFASPGSDFRLVTTSRGIDEGMTLPDVTVDADGKPRPLGAAYDIGAYESE